MEAGQGRGVGVCVALPERVWLLDLTRVGWAGVARARLWPEVSTSPRLLGPGIGADAPLPRRSVAPPQGSTCARPKGEGKAYNKLSLSKKPSSFSLSISYDSLGLSSSDCIAQELVLVVHAGYGVRGGRGRRRMLACVVFRGWRPPARAALGRQKAVRTAGCFPGAGPTSSAGLGH